ncbi:MAG: transcription termination/antitermination NusG family protein [Phycisphaeraceae bacterium]
MTLIAAQDAATPAPSGGTPRGDGVASQWFVVHTRSRQEKALAGALAAMGVVHYLPLASELRYHGRRKVRAELPLFPGYLFLRGQRDDAFAADRTGRVVRVIPVPDQAGLTWELDNIRLALACDAPLQPHAALTRGVRVEVRTGPFRGVQGVVEQRGKRDRLFLQVETLGRAAVLEIDASLLDVIS